MATVRPAVGPGVGTTTRMRITMMTALDRARQLKHQVFIQWWRPRRFAFMNRTEPFVQRWHEIRPYRYDVRDFPGLGLDLNLQLTGSLDAPVPRVIYAFWTGDNAMSPVRRAVLESLVSVNRDIPVRLITPVNLADYVLSEHPLHPAYEHLHYVHRADYLRAYFLHLHGGGYADIKRTVNSWTPAFERLDASRAWFMGYRNPVRWMTPNFPDPRLQRLMVRTSDVRLGQAAYIARAGTPITAEWLWHIERILDEAADDLAAHPGDARGSDPNYPLGWNEILAQVLDPLTVKYAEHLLYEATLLYDTDADYL